MNIIITITFVLLSLLSFNGFAITTENSHQDKLIKQGEIFFEKKQFSKAIEIYERLVNNTNSSNKLKYNLAVAYYKNSQFLKSKKLFSLLTRLPSFSPIAYLSLGLISTQENDLITAKMYFEKSIESDGTGKTSSLSKKMLLRINKENIKKRTKPKSWLHITSFKSGRENRAIDPASKNISTFAKENYFVSLSAYTAKDILTRRVENLNISFNSFLKLNKSNSDFNFFLLSSALTKTVKIKKWQLSPSVNTNYMTLGDKSFEVTIEGGFKLKRKLFKKHNLQLQYKKALINGIGQEYDPFDGTQEKLRFQSQFRYSAITVTSFYVFEKNNRNNKINGKNKFDYSPTRNKISLSLELKPIFSLKPKFEFSWRKSQYKINDRADILIKIRTKIDYVLSRKISVFVDAELTKNNSNSETYSYSRNLLSLGIKHLTW